MRDQAKNVPSEWREGSANVKITDIKFAEGDTEQNER